MKTYLLTNSDAGGWQQSGDPLARLASEAGIETIDLGSYDFANLSVKTGRLIVAGGDGTLSRVVNKIGDRIQDLDLALIPTGTGNDLARSLDLQGKPIEEVWQRAVSAPSVPIDLIRVTNGDAFYLLNAATGGFGGMVSTDVIADDKRRWGPMAYWFTAFSKLAELQEVHVRLELDSQTLEMHTYGLAIANGRYVGGGFPVAPKATLNDGKLDVTTVPNLPTIELVAAGVDFMLGRYHDPNRVRTCQSSSVRVIAEPTMPFSFDGEASRRLEAVFEVVPGAMKIVPGVNPVAM